MVAEQNTTTAALQSVAVTTVTTPEQKPSKPTLDHNVPIASDPPTPKIASIDLHESKSTHPEPNADTILPTLSPDVTDNNKIQQPPTPISPPAAAPNQFDTSDLVDSPESESEYESESEAEIEKTATSTLSPPPAEVSPAADASTSVSNQTLKDSAKMQEQPVLAAQKPSPQSSNASSTIIQKTPPNTTNTSTKNASQPLKTAVDNAVAPPTPTKVIVKDTTSATTQASSAKSTTNTADSASSASNNASSTIANEDGNFHRNFFFQVLSMLHACPHSAFFRLGPSHT